MAPFYGQTGNLTTDVLLETLEVFCPIDHIGKDEPAARPPNTKMNVLSAEIEWMRSQTYETLLQSAPNCCSNISISFHHGYHYAMQDSQTQWYSIAMQCQSIQPTNALSLALRLLALASSGRNEFWRRMPVILDMLKEPCLGRKGSVASRALVSACLLL